MHSRYHGSSRLENDTIEKRRPGGQAAAEQDQALHDAALDHQLAGRMPVRLPAMFAPRQCAERARGV
jgi:hypothetical protein